ncbi:MFS general substrate transporter [Penicillium alfredii]|uniref:MFS general substrate transporter n=1 Tax=Penicillium alfredii TaxID=1506179 RepID=A0A9W9JTS5_9EURO|nr:MFS general substrate transporter [Penicillium alfredii]KAJ5081749.1 MFS general substrate transporter [Penicillium alfredii]
MQSFLQYRQLRRDLERTIHPGDLHTTAENVGPEPNDRVISHLDDGKHEKPIVLHTGQSVVIPGVSVRQVPSISDKPVFIVGFEGPDDQFNPRNWSLGHKWKTLAIVGTTGFLVGWVSAIDSAVIKQGQEAFGVSKVAESLATSLYLIAFGFGSLIAGPFSETVGRNPVYLVTLSLLMVFIMASGLAPNFGAQLAFRFVAGLFGCTPLTTFGGSMADIFDLLDRTYAFPVCCTLSFIGPFLSPMIGAFIGQSTAISWRWSEWASLILAGLITMAIFFFVPETYAPVLLQWKARHLRAITGDQRFLAEAELHQTKLHTQLLSSCVRPFQLFFGELMVALFTLYLVVVYIVLFGFLTGYDFIFGETYGFSQGSVGLTFIGMNIGFLIAFALIPHIYTAYRRRLKTALTTGDDDGHPPAEERLWFAMYAAPWFPISLLWMGWTCYPGVSYWSPLIGSVAFGFSVQGIFISSYAYLIDTYERFAASALVSATFMRYIAAGAMVVVSIPMYTDLGVHWSLTLLGFLALLMTPVPYVFYKFGHVFRARSKAVAAR